MTQEELSGALIDRMQGEQEKFRDWLLSQPPEKILDYTFEYTVRNDILIAAENNSLSEEQVEALLKSDSPLADVFKDFSKLETNHMETIQETLENRADREIQKEQERREAIRNLPIYPNDVKYARANGEMEQYRASYRANESCRDAIEKAIKDNYSYENSSFDAKTAISQVEKDYGYDRMLYVLAATVKDKGWDQRISPANKKWAETQTVNPDKDDFGRDRNTGFVLTQAHTGLIDMFITDARRECLLSQPLTVPEIRDEAQRLLDCLQKPDEPNSPNGTHLMAEISQDFLMRASSRDTTALQRFLPFKSLALTTMKDRNGVFAVIAGDEKRDRKLREPRPSVLAKLQNTPSATTPKYSAKSRSDPEL